MTRYRAPEFPRLPQQGLKGREGFDYVPDPKLIAAANAALALQMPLLLTGEPGCGKTDFAWAAARGLASDAQAGPTTGEPLQCYVRSDSRARDLLYHYDAIQRFGDAQHGGESGRARAENPRPYIRLQPLGEALMSPHLRVVLIDEIDKAPRDLPNDLLRELDQGHFEIQEIPEARSGVNRIPPNVDDPTTYQRTMIRPRAEQRPFVIITSNVERQLPDPFLRRCLFFHIPFPEGSLRAILTARFPDSDLLVEQALEIFGVLRETRTLTKKPATSELLNWVHALSTVFDRADVTQALTAFRGARQSLRGTPAADLDWGTLPALSCLVKLREDLDRLGVRV